MVLAFGISPLCGNVEPPQCGFAVGGTSVLSVRKAFEREEPEGVGRPRVDEPIVCGLGREGQEGKELYIVAEAETTSRRSPTRSRRSVRGGGKNRPRGRGGSRTCPPREDVLLESQVK